METCTIFDQINRKIDWFDLLYLINAVHLYYYIYVHILYYLHAFFSTSAILKMELVTDFFRTYEPPKKLIWSSLSSYHKETKLQ